MIVRVVLDTCIARKHLQGDGTTIDGTALTTSREQPRLSLAGTAGAELLEQLIDNRLPFAEWANRVRTFDELLDPRWPILPTGRQLSAIAGTQTDLSVDLEEERHHLSACWRLMRDARCVEDLQRAMPVGVRDGQLIGVRLDRERLKRVMDSERQSWIAYIERMNQSLVSEGIGPSDRRRLISLMRSTQGTGPGDPPDLARRLDAVTRMLADFVVMSLGREPYNPRIERRRGDTFDLSLLYYVPLPAIVCTADGSFLNRLRASGAEHSGQVVSVEEFNELVVANRLTDVVAGFQTPEEQDDRWQKAAYYSWIGRGQPIGDEWADWFGTEPVA